MKKHRVTLVLVLLISLLATSSIFAASEYDYYDIKVGKTYGVNERLRINSNGGLYLLDGNSFREVQYGDSYSYIDVELNYYGDIVITTDRGAEFNYNPRDNSVFGNIDREPVVNIGGKDYRGYVKFVVNDNKLYIVNRVNVEDYVKGILPKEMSQSFPEEALKAQAVASRSFAAANKDKFISSGYNLDDTTSSQVYGGKSVETDKTNRAVDDTRGQYMYYAGEVADTMYHASSGGKTESSTEVWSGKNIPYLVSVEDEYSTHHKDYEWQLKYSVGELTNLLSGLGSFGTIQNIEVGSVTSTGRAKDIKIYGSAKTESVSASKFRAALGNTKCKSTSFEIISDGTIANAESVKETLAKPNPKYSTDEGEIEVVNFIKLIASEKSVGTSEHITIRGRGYGHGVGMSQYGAAEMANRGNNYRAILEHYYRGVSIY